MGQKFSRLFCVLCGIVAGYYLAVWYCNIFEIKPVQIKYANTLGIVAAFGMMGYLFAPNFHRELISFDAWIDKLINILTPQKVLAGLIGSILGIIALNVMTIPIFLSTHNKLFLLPFIILGDVIFAYIGASLISATGLFMDNSGIKNSTSRKILDTSTIIDGRMLDVLKTGFLEGKIIIPNFVLQELRHIADSSDNLRRKRGRRGLDIVKEMKELFPEKVDILDVELNKNIDVDDHLVMLAKKLSATVITNDYNLNKQASTQGVNILNVNDLTNALKSVALPGEEMEILLVREGKENEQAVGYLEDGTMIVVDNAKEFIGEKIDIEVTNVLQTPAGRVIFGKTKEAIIKS